MLEVQASLPRYEVGRLDSLSNAGFHYVKQELTEYGPTLERKHFALITVMVLNKEEVQTIANILQTRVRYVPAYSVFPSGF